MLVLSRRRDSAIQIGADVEITVLGIQKGRVRLGTHAPDDVLVRRGELSPLAGGNYPHAASAARPVVKARRPR